jgi:hypothetical protein
MAALPSPRCNKQGPQTLAECLVLFEKSMANEISRGSVAAKRRISAARNTAKRIQQMFGAPAHRIRLDDLVEIDSQLVGVTNGRGRSALTSTCKWRSLRFARRSAVQAWRSNSPNSTVTAELVRNTGLESQISRPNYGRN